MRGFTAPSPMQKFGCHETISEQGLRFNESGTFPSALEGAADRSDSAAITVRDSRLTLNE